MSPWLQSVTLCLKDWGEDSRRRAKCIVQHLSSPVPQSQWEFGLEGGGVRDEFVHILNSLCEEIIAVLGGP
ncbi:MAG: hypothetical protein DRH12_17215 [Deltaproteobacteria bacterium]|nr:MAG: hypothetical protein DRH12_17215 [Deltaproteobacteria bacterium]